MYIYVVGTHLGGPKLGLSLGELSCFIRRLPETEIAFDPRLHLTAPSIVASIEISRMLCSERGGSKVSLVTPGSGDPLLRARSPSCRTCDSEVRADVHCFIFVPARFLGGRRHTGGNWLKPPTCMVKEGKEGEERNLRNDSGRKKYLPSACHGLE